MVYRFRLSVQFLILISTVFSSFIAHTQHAVDVYRVSKVPTASLEVRDQIWVKVSEVFFCFFFFYAFVFP